MKLTPMQRSVLAIIFCVLFLWTGKKFIWNNEVPSNEAPGSMDSQIAELTPSDTTTTPVDATTTTTVSTETTADITGEYTYTDTTKTLSDTVTSTSSTTSAESTTTSTSTTTTTTTTPAAAPSVGGLTQAPEGYFNDALFIGDSRTVGMANYGPLPGATYFASVGMGAYNIDKAKSETGTTTGLDIDTVLRGYNFRKVYIMLGINEIGNNREATQKCFQSLLDRVRAAQPNAIIYIEANLHVSLNRSSKDKVVNNENINSYNTWLATLADNETIYYLDVNPVFDDENGCLAADSTGDGTHPYAKLYLTWSEWLQQHAIVDF